MASFTLGMNVDERLQTLGAGFRPPEMESVGPENGHCGLQQCCSLSAYYFLLELEAIAIKIE